MIDKSLEVEEPLKPPTPTANSTILINTNQNSAPLSNVTTDKYALIQV